MSLTYRKIVEGYIHESEPELLNPNLIFPDEIITLCHNYYLPRYSLKIAKVTDKSYEYFNYVYLNPCDMELLILSPDGLLLIDEKMVFQVKPDPKLPIGQLGCSVLVCESLNIPLKSAAKKKSRRRRGIKEKSKEYVNTVVIGEPWRYSKQNKKHVANNISIMIDNRYRDIIVTKNDKMKELIYENLKHQIFCQDQQFIVTYSANKSHYWLKLCVYICSVYNIKEKSTFRQSYKLIPFASIDTSTNITLYPMHFQYTDICMSPVSFPPESFGISGLEEEFHTIGRRIMCPRVWPVDIINTFGIKHIINGMIFYGPSQTDQYKLLFAKGIASMLTDNTPTIIDPYCNINNVYSIWEDPIKEHKQNGDESSLYVIIFKQIDIICNQNHSFLPKYILKRLLFLIDDDVNGLDNILIIGITNKKYNIDNSYLRPGRLEVHIQIDLPNNDHRECIFLMNTKSMREHGYWDFDDISLSYADLAAETINYSGTEIESIVRCAVCNSLNQYIIPQKDNHIKIRKLPSYIIKKKHFDAALHAIEPELGINSKMRNKLSFLYNEGIIIFNEKVKEIIDLCSNILNKMTSINSCFMNRQSLLLKGDIGSGKTALSAYIANEIGKWQFIRIISADNYVNILNENQVCLSINKIFNNAYKSNKSIIILDNLERLIRYNYIVSLNKLQFSNNILNSILICIRRLNTLNQNRKIFIIATCSHELSVRLQLNKKFDFVRILPTITCKMEFKNVLIASGYKNRCKPNMDCIVKAFQMHQFDKIGIVKMLKIIELAVNDKHYITTKSFLNCMKLVKNY